MLLLLALARKNCKLLCSICRSARKLGVVQKKKSKNVIFSFCVCTAFVWRTPYVFTMQWVIGPGYTHGCDAPVNAWARQVFKQAWHFDLLLHSLYEWWLTLYNALQNSTYCLGTVNTQRIRYMCTFPTKISILHILTVVHDV